jgi:hypothetical protein
MLEINTLNATYVNYHLLSINRALFSASLKDYFCAKGKEPALHHKSGSFFISEAVKACLQALA